MCTKKLQIMGQLGNKIYTQNEEPIGAPDGTLWVDLDADGMTSEVGGSTEGAVLYTEQELTPEQQAQARKNIGAAAAGEGGGSLLTIETIIIGETGNVPVTGITLDYNSVSLNEGESMMLAASVSPSNATNNKVLWMSNNTDVATINNGYVTAVSAGNAVITAYSAENNAIKATCSVAVASVSGEVKVLLSSIDMVSGLMKNDGKTTYSVDGGYHVEIPCIEGMFISTGSNAGWVANYPPFIVVDNGTVTVPEYMRGGSVSVGNKTANIFTVTLSGFSESAKVYVNILAGTSGNVTAQECMNSADVYYYTYEA